MENIAGRRSLSLWTMLLLALGWFTIATTAFAATADLAWNQSNIDTLRALDKSAVAELVNDIRDTGGLVPRPTADEIGEFAWADLGGNGSYQLVLTEDVNGRHFYNALIVYGRDSSGKMRAQEIRGWQLEKLGGVVRDLDGDGKNELIIPSQLASDTYRGAGAVPVWPAVYRLENGHYVEASRDFPDFYDNEILPELEKQISKARAGQTRAWLIMERDKILRMLGRNPTAGLQEAYQWIHSDDPEVRQDAAVVFGDLGGHEHELRALSADKDPRVASAATFAMSHGAGSFNRYNHWRSGTIVNSGR